MHRIRGPQRRNSEEDEEKDGESVTTTTHGDTDGGEGDGSGSSSTKNNRVVLVWHGLMQCSEAFVSLDKDKGLVFLLANQG